MINLVINYINIVIVLTTLVITTILHQQEKKSFTHLQLAYVEFLLYTISIISGVGGIYNMIFQRYFALSGGANFALFLRNYGKNSKFKRIFMLIIHIYKSILAMLIVLSAMSPLYIDIYLGQALFTFSFIVLILYYIVIIDISNFNIGTLVIFVAFLIKALSFGLSFFGVTIYFMNLIFYIYMLIHILTTYRSKKS